jgi:hypothetical protein
VDYPPDKTCENSRKIDEVLPKLSPLSIRFFAISPSFLNFVVSPPQDTQKNHYFSINPQSLSGLAKANRR